MFENLWTFEDLCGDGFQVLRIFIGFQINPDLLGWLWIPSHKLRRFIPPVFSRALAIMPQTF
jgi:hypothetical protein